MEIRNAVIDSTMLGYEDHGILTAFVGLDYGGSHQGFGGYFLDGEALSIFVKGVLKVVGVDSWEKLKGRTVRAEADYGAVKRIGHFLRDEWYDHAATMEARQEVTV